MSLKIKTKDTGEAGGRRWRCGRGEAAALQQVKIYGPWRIMDSPHDKGGGESMFMCVGGRERGDDYLGGRSHAPGEAPPKRYQACPIPLRVGQDRNPPFPVRVGRGATVGRAMLPMSKEGRPE